MSPTAIEIAVPGSPTAITVAVPSTPAMIEVLRPSSPTMVEVNLPARDPNTVIASGGLRIELVSVLPVPQLAGRLYFVIPTL